MSSESQLNDEAPDTGAANDIIHKQQFGVLLRIEREQQNLTHLDVAESLRLTEANIRALENSCIDELPGKAFTLGYIRSYTRLLNVPDQVIIDAYLEYYNEEEKPLQNTSNIKIKNIKNNTMYLAAAVLLVLFVAVSIFISGDDDSAEAPVSTEMPAEVKADEPFDIKNKTVTQPEAKISEDKPVDKTSTDIKTVAPLKPSVTKTSQTLAQKTKPVASSDDVLSVQVRDQSWAKIEDANGQRLFYATLMPGEDYQFNGVSPFKVFLGNAPAVQLSVNHQEVDLKSHIKSNNVAQITIDETANIQ